MKKFLIAMTMLLTLGMTQSVPARGQQPKDEKELVDSTRQDDALEAYSDTTDVVDSTVVSQSHRIGGYLSDDSLVNSILDGVGVNGIMGMVFVLCILLIIFIIAPVAILAVLFFFIYKNRKQKMQLAEMAMKQGQPIPNQLLEEHKENEDVVWQKGIRQTFLGIGLLAFFGYTGSTLGIGIGIIVTAIGVGKLVIVKTTNKDK